MRIGVDACCWTNRRGYGRFTRELLPVLFRQAPKDRFICFSDGTTSGFLPRDFPNVEIVSVELDDVPTEVDASRSRSLSDLLRLTREVWSRRPDVFFFPSVYTYFPLPPGQPALVGVHDTIAERHPALTLPSRRARWFWRAKVALALRQADLVLTVSRFAAEQIAEILGVSADVIRVAEEAPSDCYSPSESPEAIREAARSVGLPDGARWLVYVGGFNPHKRVDALVRAHARLVSELDSDERAPHLLLVGSLDDVFHENRAEIETTIEMSGTEDLVRWTGFLADDKLRHLHSGSVALVLPSESEGFGLPAVEAASCGAPVVATSESPLPELLAGGGIFVEPGSIDELAAGMGRLLRDPGLRRRMGERARERAGRLSWDRTADAVRAALAEITS